MLFYGTFQQNINIIIAMNQSTSKGSISLDLSNHTLNKSSSKQQFSFPKSNRFKYPKSVCDSFYEVPAGKAQRTTSFGYGQKDMGIRRNRYNAEPGSYNLDSEFNNNPKRGTSFGPGRQEMKMGGPLNNSVLQKYIPGPGNYKNFSTLDNSNITLKPKLPDLSQRHLVKNPGPGTYQQPQIGKQKYYVTSKFPNKTNYAKISPPHMDRPANRTINVGPGQYETKVTELNPDGKYVLSKNKGSKSRQFSKSPRESIVYKHLLSTPGPTNYTPFTYFGPA